jgi:hypothetical protein
MFGEKMLTIEERRERGEGLQQTNVCSYLFVKRKTNVCSYKFYVCFSRIKSNKKNGCFDQYKYNNITRTKCNYVAKTSIAKCNYVARR